MSIAPELLHWSFLAGALALGFRLFRDLADLSQWWLDTPRSKVMSTFYKRHWLTGATVGLWLGALGTLLWVGGGNTIVFGVASVALLFMVYSGYVNPHIMMRSQQYDGRFVDVEEAARCVAPDESVIVIEKDGVARAHPDYQILRPHVAGRAEGLEGENVVMTYCGLTNMGIAYKPEIDGKPLDLGVMTQLENNLVMWDRNSGEPVQQFWGTRESDGPDGHRMSEWPSFRMPLRSFARAYPDGRVFVNPMPSFTGNPFLALYDRVMDRIFVHGITDQAVNEAPTFPTIRHFDPRLPNKAKVYGVNVGDDYVAYTEDFIHAEGNLVNATVGGRDIVVAYDPEYESVGMYYNDSGIPVSRIDFWGDSDRGRLPRVETMKSQAYWVVWANFFPGTDLNRKAEVLQAAA